MSRGGEEFSETRWSDSTATSFLQNYPGYNLVHTSALATDQGGLSGGAAILIPCSFRLSREVVIAPGRIVAAHIQSRADSCWVVSTYCHPTTAGQDLETLTSWITDHQNESDPFFILGDFNHGHISAPNAWQRLLELSQVEDIVNDEPAYWGPHGTSSLDKVLLPIDYLNRGLIQYHAYYDCHFENAGHACVTVQLKHRPPVVSSQDLPIHMTLPSAVFQPGKDRHDTRCGWPSLTALIRRISLLKKPTFETLQGLLWQWWMSLPSRPRDYHTLRKHLQSNHSMLNISQQLLRELLTALPGFHPTLSEFCQSTTTITVPRTFLWRCFELLDLQIQQQHWITRNRAETHRSRGLGTTAPLWQRLRASCPRSVFYNGPIQDGEGKICRTDRDLSAAMLATRKFWFQPPPRYDTEWAEYLEQYKTQIQTWPRVLPPCEEDFVKSILASNDSAPGPDGIPYAAWRIYPRPAAVAMITHLEDICRGGAPPPCSVQAWIPKAKMGPTADNFRPLGMPSTFERVIDGTIASVLTKAVAPLLHPSQTVLNVFREPQGAVQSVQTILDQSLPCAVLSLDLSKAFERINPYWILQILAACKAPLWIITYTRHILLFRRSRHKVQGRLLPSKMIVTGVDMGRSFSVLLFCIAMDPILTYLNRIPGVLTVQGYVDDTTLAGDTAAGMQWLSDVWTICKKLRTAGIQIDEHHCWRANGARMNAPQSGCLADFPALDWVHHTRGYATLYQALAKRAGCSTTTLVSRGQNFVCLTPTQVDQILAGETADILTDLFLTQCGCANKCSVLVNHQAAQNTLNALERSNWGVHLIEGKATALGLILYGRFSRSKQGWIEVPELEGTNAINPKAMTKANHRLALFATPAHSVIQRSLANNCFILSLNIYQSTYFGFNWDDINLYQQRTAKLLLGRPWITARYLPHIFRWLGIAPTLDPAITLTAACLGYWLRQSGSAAILPPGCPEEETRQGAVVQRIFQSWVPMLGVDKTGQLLNTIAGQCTRAHHRHFLMQLKKALYEAIQVHALRYLHAKVNQQLLPGGVSWSWVTKLASLPKLAVNGIARFAVLRWAVNEDDDECLRLRVQGNLQAERPCLVCAIHTRLYPKGLQFSPMCEKCCHDHNVNATTLGSEQRWGLPLASRWFQIAEAVRGTSLIDAEWATLDRQLAPCVACGLGDNSTQHWARYCIIPVLVANELTPVAQKVSSLDQLARTNNTGCVIASHILHQFRRLLLEHGGMQHAQSAVQLSSNEWATRLYDNTVTATPTRYLPPHVELIRPHQPDPLCRTQPCSMKETSNEAVSLQSAALPDLICTATTTIQDGQTIAVLSVGHPWLRLITPPHWQTAGLLPNATITRTQSDPIQDLVEETCAVVALKPIEPDEMILVHDRPEPSNTVIQLVGQFDGSCLREEKLGGAGYVIYAVEQGRSRVIALRSVCLPNCSDNIEAEIVACQYLSEELADTIAQLLAQGYHRPQVVIQGDILPVIKYFQFAARLRRIDMAQPLEIIRTIMCRAFPQALYIYLPRIANCIADDLAGQASHFLLGKFRRDPQQFHRDAGAVSIKPTLPAALFQAGGFQIQSHENPWACKATVLVEMPHVDHSLLRRHLTLKPHHRQILESYLSPCTTQQPQVEIAYSPRSSDRYGRHYCNTVGGQRLPRDVRLLLFGHSHAEIDLKGSFYELTRRLGMRFLPHHIPLPPIGELRAALARDPYINAVERESEGIIKKLPLMVVNSSVETTYRYLHTIREGSPAANVDATLRELLALSQTLATQLLPRYRPSCPIGRNDSAFRLLEYFEARIVHDTINSIANRHPTHSVVWLHDGFLISPPPADEVLRKVEADVLIRHELFFDEPWFRISSMREDLDERRSLLRGAASAPLLALSRRKPLAKQNRATTMQGRPQIPMSPLEALSKLRARREKRES